MLLIPAIDLRNNKCVRLRQGRYDDTTVFSDDPLAMAMHWAEQGAERLHIIDLDGALNGKPCHSHIVEDIAKHLPNIPIQVGGGIRDEIAVQKYIDSGCSYVILGTRAACDPDFINRLGQQFENRIIIGLDIKDGKVATDGWGKLSRYSALDLIKQFSAGSIAGVLHTDISRDGMLNGANINSSNQLATAIDVPVIIAGGFGSLDDIRLLNETHHPNLQAAVLGRSLYEKTIVFSEALHEVKKSK